MGYIRGLVHGTVIGTIAGLCIAPQPGVRTREQLSAFGHAARDAYGIAEQTVRKVAPYAEVAVATVRRSIDKATDKSADSAETTGRRANGYSHSTSTSKTTTSSTTSTPPT